MELLRVAKASGQDKTQSLDPVKFSPPEHMEQAVIVAECPDAVAWHATIVDALAIWELMLERLLFLASNDLGIVIHNNTCMKTARFGISTTRLHKTPGGCYAIGMLCYWHCLKTAHGGMGFVCLDMVLPICVQV